MISLSLNGQKYGLYPESEFYFAKTVGEMIGVPTLHPHDFRHSGSNLLKNAGMSLEDVSALLQHEGTDVTVKHYLRVDKNKVKQNKDRFEI